MHESDVSVDGPWSGRVASGRCHRWSCITLSSLTVLHSRASQRVEALFLRQSLSAALSNVHLAIEPLC